jgi:phenylacetate-CoA ligase
LGLEDALYRLLPAWEHTPIGLKRVIGWTYRQLPDAVRLGTSFGAFGRLAGDVESWSQDRLREYQLEQLRLVLDRAARYCPAYGRRFAEAGFRPRSVSTLDDLEACPTLTKADLVRDLPDLVATDTRPSQRLYITTGGSTGVPVGFYLQKGVSRPKEQAFLEAQWRRAGYVPGSRLAVIRGHVTSDRARGSIATYDPTRDWLMLSSYHLTEQRLPEYLEAIERFQPDLLHAYPSAALQLAEFLERTGARWPVALRGVLAGSERLTLPQKRLLERIFSCRVYRWYGHAERVVLAGEGRDSELFYFWPVYGLVEFGPPDAEGLREVIGTSFHNTVMPLIRYRTGDYVRVADEPTDGHFELPWPAVSAVEGREQEFLVSATGRRISLTAFNMHDTIFDDLYAVQFVQDEEGKAEFHYVPGPRFTRSRLPRIESGIRRKLGDDFDVTMREVSETEKTARGKHRWLVSRL